MTEYQQSQWLEILRERFGQSPLKWAFRCPQCGDVATGADFKAALSEHPREHSGGSPILASDILGQECIGRTLGALHEKSQQVWDVRRKAGEVRGCDWCAFGLFHGPDSVISEVNGKPKTLWAFPIADVPDKDVSP